MTILTRHTLKKDNFERGTSENDNPGKEKLKNSSGNE